MSGADDNCPFCVDAGGEILFENALCRVVLLDGEEGRRFPGFCRVIAKRHVREMSDLTPDEQERLLAVVLATERAVRDVQRPDKMNIASLGNVTPHVHWHVIPRWTDDSHFPAPIWAAAQRVGAARPAAAAHALRTALHASLPAI